MQPPQPGHRVFRFGSYDVDLEQGTLSKGGIRIRLQGQPFQVLALLVERAGEVITREEIRQKLWSQDTFVEFDDGLNVAVRKLRGALGDSADNPRFVETVPRRGYRFLAPVTSSAWPPTPSDRHVGVEAQTATASLPAADSQTVTQKPIQESRPGRRLWYLASAAALLLVIVVAGTLWRRHSRFRITSKDTVVLADFSNTTGEAVFDDALRQGLEIGLEQSPFVRVLSDRKTAVILKQMGHSPDERLTSRTALELCQRTGSKVTVQGSIASLGTTYLIGLAAIRCDTGEPIANEQVPVKRKEEVVDALGDATAQLRARLGESVPSIQKYNAPLEQATTPSLDALKAYGQALATWDKYGDQASLPLFKRAIELDPNFAMAYGGLATIYHNLQENELARKNTTRAFELRDRVTESERSVIEARYYTYVTGELEKALQVYQLRVREYPGEAGAFSHLGNVQERLGQVEEALASYRESVRLDPTRANSYASAAEVLLALNRTDEAGALLQEAEKRNLLTDALLQVSYRRAFLRGDAAEMRRLLTQSSDVPSAQSLLLAEQANTEAYYGGFEKAGELSGVAKELMEHNGDQESAADCLAVAAVREAEVGASARALQFLAQAMKLNHGQDVTTLAAIVLSQTGNIPRALQLSEELDKASPSGTFIQKYWLPVIRAKIEIQRGAAAQAISTLKNSAPLEFASPGVMPVTAIYPAFVRGQAYLQLGDSGRAATEFQKLIDHPAMVANFSLGPLAHLGRARALARSGDTAKARAAYQDFLELWKNADPDIPVLKSAKAEFAKLH